jgi:hypothetical protein
MSFDGVGTVRGGRRNGLRLHLSAVLASGIVPLAALLVAVPSGRASAQAAAAPPPPIVAPSSFASVEVHVSARAIGKRWNVVDAGLSGPSRIAITYGQPAARGRKVEGGLIPRDTVWRFGANMAATLHTDVDLTLGTLQLAKGDYSLYLLDGSTGWQLIVNRQTAQWGTDYDASKDLGRTALTHRALAEPMESFVVFLVPNWTPGQGNGNSALRGTLTMMWGSSALSTDWQVIPPK